MPVHVQPVPWDGTPRDCGVIWRLTLRDRVAVCRLFSHPVGAEVRLDVALTWREQFEAKGWTP